VPVIFQPLMQILCRVRRCPKCGRKQIVRPAHKEQVVSCKHCGAEIPPSCRGGRA